jgi:hypothetical protein
VIDFDGDTATLGQVIEPRLAILGTHVVPANRYLPSARPCPHCGHQK